MDIKLLEMRRKALIESNGNFTLFNQLMPNFSSDAGMWWDSSHYNCIFSSGVLQLKVKNTNETSNNYDLIFSYYPGFIVGHVYYIHYQYLSSALVYFNFDAGLPKTFGKVTSLSSDWKRRAGIRMITSSNSPYGAWITGSGRTRYSSGSSFIKLRNPCVIDLTKMFGEGNQPAYGSGASDKTYGDPEAFFSKCATNGIDLSTYQSNTVTRSISWIDT